MVCKADTRVYTSSGKNSPTSSRLLLLVLPCTGVPIVGVTSFLREGTDPRSLGGGMCVCETVSSSLSKMCASCVLDSFRRALLDVAPAFLFIVPKGRARVTNKIKWEKTKEKNKKGGLGCGRLPPYSVEIVPCNAEMQWALIFWPLHPLVQHTVAMLRPVCFCAVVDGRYMRPDLRREGVR
jgi:hypothetical protein